MPPASLTAALPRRLDDRQSSFVTRELALDLGETMRRVRAAVTAWEVERSAIRSVVRDHATISLDVSRWTELCVRFEAVEASDRMATAVCAAITVRATAAGLAAGVVLLNTLVGIPVAWMARRRERARAFGIGRSLVDAVFAALEREA